MADQETSDPASVAKATEPVESKDESSFFEPYSALARSIRVWFIAYGIGGPVLFLNNQTATKALLASGWARPIAFGFLAGVAAQILVALVYKAAMWYLYLGELTASFQSRRRYRLSLWLSECYWLESVVDLSTLALFVWATYRAIGALAP